MALQLTKDELAHALMLLINEMVTRKQLPGFNPAETKDFASKVADRLLDDKSISFTPLDLTKDNIKDNLKLACKAENATKLNPEFKFDIKLLFKPQTKENKDKLKEELKKLFLEFVKNNPQLKQKLDANPKAFEDKLNFFVDKLIEKNARDDKNTNFSENPSILNILTAVSHMLEDQQREQRVQFYGVDTQNPGGESETVSANPYGNIAGAQDLQQGPSPSFAGDANNPDFGVPDPLGLKFRAILNVIASNADDPALEKEMVGSGLIPSGTSLGSTPRLTPNG